MEAYDIGLAPSAKRQDPELTAPKGEVIEVETAIPLREVPKVALDAFKAEYPHLKATGAESVAEGGQVVAYDILTRKDHKSVEYRVSADGKTVKFEEEEEEEEE
jgi:hypothetical protein